MKRKKIGVISAIMICGSLLCGAGKNADGYNLTVIPDENIPMAPAPVPAEALSTLYIGTVVLMIGLIFFAIIFVYHQKCKKYRERIRFLEQNMDEQQIETKDCGWNLFKLHERTEKLENKIAEEIA